MSRASIARDTFQVLLLVALGDLLLDIRRDALVGFVQRGLAGDGLAEPADHRVEDHAVVDVALQLVGNRRELRHAFAEDLQRGLALRRGALVLEPFLGEAEMARHEERPLVEFLRPPSRWRDTRRDARPPSDAGSS